jgi:hypothetical protein
MAFLFCSERGPLERNVKEDGQDSPTFHILQNLGLWNRADAEQRLDQTLAEARPNRKLTSPPRATNASNVSVSSPIAARIFF